MLIQVKAALDPAAATFLHAAPVLERVGNETLGRNAGDGLVPVLHLDGMQGDVDDISVGIELRHFHPVADANQVIGGDLHTGDQRQQGVLEDQHQHGGHGAQAGEQDQRRAVDQCGDDENGGDRVQPDLDYLQVALDRVDARIRAPLVEHVDDVQHAAERQRDGQYDEAATHVAHHRDRGFGQAGHRMHAGGEHQRRHDVRQPLDDAEILDVAGARMTQQLVQPAHQDAFDDPVRDPGGKHQCGACQERLQVRMGIEPVEPTGQFFCRHSASLRWRATGPDAARP